MRITAAVTASLIVHLAVGCATSADGPDLDAIRARRPSHPLDPLTWSEIETARAVLEKAGKLGDGVFVPILVLHEPSKEAVRAFRGSGPIRREAFAVVLDRPKNVTSEALIDLSERRLASWKSVEGVQPNVLEEEFSSVPKIVKADPAWRAAIARRGITDVEKVLVDTWAAGVLPSPNAPQGARLSRALSFYKGDSKNAYGRPIEGVVAVVDVNARKVVEVVDTGVRPLAPRNQDFTSEALGPPRKGLKPLSVEQPEGPSFEIDGNRVRWQKWDFRFALHPREGLVLYTVGYEDGGVLRPILHRASISEMVVPYGDPDVNWAWRAAFDEGEYGLGRLANPLEEGKDAPANARFVPAVMADETGLPKPWWNAVALYERDGGILWKHFDERGYSRRARQLVLMYAVTVGNYDYFIHWIFHQDGSIEARAEASGILLAKGVPQETCRSCAAADGKPATGDERTGALVAERIVAPNHQHFFSFRLDFDVDGTANSVAEMDVSGLPEGPDNPHSNGFAVEKKPLPTERAARRNIDAPRHRHWKVYNSGAKGPLGHDPAYLLVPGENTASYLGAAAATSTRAAFINHHLWVTRYHPAEMNAAGYYPNQSAAARGLPEWTQDDQPIVGQDVVLWYTAGLTHLPRPEEWPIMPTAGVGFKLVPAGFFARNPGLDVPED